MEARMYNDRIMMLERAFLDSAGTPQNPLQKYILSKMHIKLLQATKK